MSIQESKDNKEPDILDEVVVIRNMIKKELVVDVEDKVLWRTRWYKISNVLEAVSKLFLVSSTLLSFTSTYQNNNTYAFFAGCSGTLSIITVQLSQFARKESNERTLQLNSQLKNMNLPVLPTIEITDEDKKEEHK